MDLKRIASVRVGSVAKVAAVFSWLLGTMMSVFVVLRLAFEGTLDLADIIAVGLLALLYPVIGVLAGVIAARLYNLVAGWIGGIEIELKDVPAAPDGPDGSGGAR